MVFQNYALYPHLSVYENIAFGLRLRREAKDEIERRVTWAAQMLDLTEFLDRKPKQLSGGQRQRVAMGRAIVRQPQVFLMDEPLSNLDAKLRVQMRADIAKLQHELNDDDDLRHPRPGRGDDHGGPRRRDAGRRPPAGRPTAGALRHAGQPLRRRLHRHAADEPSRSDRLRERVGLARARRYHAPGAGRGAPRVSGPARARTARRSSPGSAASSSTRRPSGRICRRSPGESSSSRRSAATRWSISTSTRTPSATAGTPTRTSSRKPARGSVECGPNLVADFPSHVQLRLTDEISVAVDVAKLHFFDGDSGEPLR